MDKAVTKNQTHRAALDKKPIEIYGLKLWGITMAQYEEWAECKKVWLSRQSTFPVFCISMTFLDALLALDMKAMESVGKPLGYIHKILYGLAMALRLDENCLNDKTMTISIDEERKRLKAIVVNLPNGNGPVEITPQKFNVVRQIVAWMQGEELPDESMNDELLETAADLAERNAPNLKYDLMDMQASVAAEYRIRVGETFDWTILEFETARRAIDRKLKYMICGIGATNGCKWDGGNPYPNWYFDKESDGTSALLAASQFGKTKVNKKE